MNLNAKGIATLKAFLLLAPSEERIYGKFMVKKGEGTTYKREHR